MLHGSIRKLNNRLIILLKRQQVMKGRFCPLTPSQLLQEVKCAHAEQRNQIQLIKLIVEKNWRGLSTPSGESPYLEVRTLLKDTLNVQGDVMRNIKIIHKMTLRTYELNRDVEACEDAYTLFRLNNEHQRVQLINYIKRGLFSEMLRVKGIVRGLLEDCPADTCPICLGEELDEALDVAILDSCRHLFCASCFKVWFRNKR